MKYVPGGEIMPCSAYGIRHDIYFTLWLLEVNFYHRNKKNCITTSIFSSCFVLNGHLFVLLLKMNLVYIYTPQNLLNYTK